MQDALSKWLGSLSLAGGVFALGCTTSELGNWQPRDINEAGVIVGSRPVLSTSQAVAYAGNGPLRDLPAPAGHDRSSAASISRDGTIVGGSRVGSTSESEALLWSPSGTLRTLPRLSGWPGGALSINNAGLVVGTASSYRDGDPFLDGVQYGHAWLCNSTTSEIFELPVPPGMVFAQPTAINDAGETVGHVSAGLTSRAVKWAPGTRALTLLPVGTSTRSEAWSINASGVIVGMIDFRPVLWPKDGEPVALPLGAYEDGAARDINDMGVIVGNLTRFPSPTGAPSAGSGVASPPPREMHAVRWTVEHELQVLEPRTGASSATAINNSGVIVGYDAVGAQRFH
jgi:uncharacterized membrane protein